MALAQTTKNAHVHVSWATRPDDTAYGSLAELSEAAHKLADRSHEKVVNDGEMRAVADPDGVGLKVELLSGDLIEPNHWSFGQMCSAAGAPASYLRKLHPELAAMNVNFGLQVLSKRDEQSLYIANGGSEEPDLRAITSPDYGRVYDHEVIDMVREVADDERDRWVSPSKTAFDHGGCKAGRSLFVSDRDCFGFLVDERNPIEIGREVLHKGFYFWNSEVGSRSFGAATFLFRSACANRLILGTKFMQRLSFRHTKSAPDRMVKVLRPQLEEFVNQSPRQLTAAVEKAQSFRIGKSDDEVRDWIRKQGHTLREARAIIERATEEEGRCRSLWDVVQGGTAFARTINHQDNRVDFERRVGRLMNRVAA